MADDDDSCYSFYKDYPLPQSHRRRQPKTLITQASVDQNSLPFRRQSCPAHRRTKAFGYLEQHLSYPRWRDEVLVANRPGIQQYIARVMQGSYAAPMLYSGKGLRRTLTPKSPDGGPTILLCFAMGILGFLATVV